MQPGRGVTRCCPRTESMPSVQLFGHRLLPALLSRCVGAKFGEVVLGRQRGSPASFLALLRSPTAGLSPSPRPLAIPGQFLQELNLPGVGPALRCAPPPPGRVRSALTRGGPDSWLGAKFRRMALGSARSLAGFRPSFLGGRGLV